MHAAQNQVHGSALAVAPAAVGRSVHTHAEHLFWPFLMCLNAQHDKIGGNHTRKFTRSCA